MSDFEFLNHPELQQIEQSLRSIPLQPDNVQHETYLYQCGLAAGRAEAKKRFRATASLTGLFALSTCCLSVMLWNQSVPSPSNHKQVAITPTITPQEIPKSTFQSGILHVGSGIDDLLVTQKFFTPNEEAPLPPANNHSIMTTRSWPELFDN